MKRKNAKSLFEVISPGAGKPRRSVGVPGWFGDVKPPAPPSEPVPQAALAAPARPAPAAPAAPAAPREPVISTSAGKLRICLGQVGAVGLVGGLLALLLLAFVLGRRTAPAGPAAPGTGQQGPGGRRPGMTRGSLPGAGTATQPRPGAGQGKPLPAGMVPDSFQRRKGYSHFIIQDRIESREEALEIKRFLYRYGINVTIQRSRLPRVFIVKDTTGFTNIRSPEVQARLGEYKAQIERLGRQYQHLGHRYDFRDPWLVTER